MPTFYSDLFPSRTSDVVGLQNRKEGFRITPRYSPTFIEYTFVGDEAAGDVIRLWKGNAGDIILPKDAGVWVTVDPAATLTLDVGDLDTTSESPFVASDADRYADGINAAAVGWVSFGTAGAAYANPYRLGEDAWITCTLATLATPAAGGKLKFYIPRIAA